MATITVASLLSRAAILLQDPSNVRWPQAELLDWLNEGQREIALFKPSAYAKNQAVQLVAGTKQSLPSDGVSLLDVVRNLGTNGTTPGAAVRMVTRSIMDAQLADWHTAKSSATVKHFIYTPNDPKRFYVYPPQPATNQGYVEVVYAAQPADAAANGTITVDDIYSSALLNYIMFRAYSKDAEFAAAPQLAASYYQAFQALLQAKMGAELGTNPNQTLGPTNPALPGGTS